MGVCGSIDEEDGIVGVNEGGIIVQSGSPASLVLAAATFFVESPVLKGVGVCVVLPGTRDEDVKGKRMGMCVNQWSERGAGLSCDGCTKCSGDLPDEGWLKDV